MKSYKKCSSCKGYGRIEDFRWGDGIAECSACQGLGVVKKNDKPLSEREWDDFCATRGEND